MAVVVGSVRVPRAGARSWPFAVGLVQAAEQGEEVAADEESSGRLAVAVAAYHAGYYLVDVIEVDARTGVTAGDLARLRAVAVRTDAEGLFVLGVDDDGRALLGPMADELRLVVRVVPGGDGQDSSDSVSPWGTPDQDQDQGRGGVGTGSAAEGVPAVDRADRIPDVIPDVEEPGRGSGGHGSERFASRTTTGRCQT
jgi:hypothetical protein